MLVEMQKLIILAHGARRNRILRNLHRSKLVMVSSTVELENTQPTDCSVNINTLNEKQAKVSFALSFMQSEKKKALRLQKEAEKAGKKFDYTPIKPPIQSSIRMSYEEYTNIPAREVELMAHINELEEIEKEYLKIASDTQKSQNFVEQLEIFAPLTLKFSTFKDTAKTTVALGAVPFQKKEELEKIIEKFPQAEFEIYGGERQLAFSFLCLKEEAEQIFLELHALEYVRSSFNFDATAEELILEEKEKLEDFELRKIILLTSALAKEVYIAEWKQLYDYYFIELAKQSAFEKCRSTKSVFILEGWFPKSQSDRLKAILDSTCDELVYEFRDPEDDEEVPTLIKSKKLFDPYEDVTNLYSTPHYREDIDPNPIMSFFYFLFFGMMIADALYGVLLAVGAFVFYKLKKPVPGKGRLLLVIAMGGVSTIIWGALFGSWFGLSLGENSFLRHLIWFEPLGDPLLMLVVCLLFGLFQIIVGMGVNAYNLIRKGKLIDAVFSVFTWYSVFIGLGLFVLETMIVKNAILKYFAIALIVLGFAAMVFGNARGKQGIGGKIKGSLLGLAKLYDGVNILSDILSYSRLFGLALSGGVVGMVINKICEVVIGMLPTIGGLPILGVLFALPIFMGGHLFNIGISALGAYVHNCRLQYIEFYGKFYSGAGYLFKPLASDTKYIYIDNAAEQKTA